MSRKKPSMNRAEHNRTRLEAEESARRDFASRLGTYADATTRVLCTCGLTMSRKAFQEHQEQTHHQEKRQKTTRDLDPDTGDSEDSSKEVRQLRHYS